jgi:hypothetical protein
MATQRSGKSALDEFLPELIFAPDATNTQAHHLPATEILLDPIDRVAGSAAAGSSAVQIWPMLAAGFVALGVSMMVLALFLKYSPVTP